MKAMHVLLGMMLYSGATLALQNNSTAPQVEPRPAPTSESSETEAITDACAAVTTTTTTSYLVRSIRFERNDIFDLNAPDSFWLHRIANQYHVVTTERTLQEDLLFDVGERVTPSLLAETERLLRQRRYLRHAEIHIVQRCGDEIDLVIKTWDNWSLLPRINIGHEGGATKTNLGFVEDNLLGTGNLVQLEYFNDSERQGYRSRFESPNIFGSHWNAGLAYADNSDGENYFVSANKPFEKIDSTWAVGTVLAKDSKELTEYALGDEINRYQSKQSMAEVEVAWRWASGANWAQRVHLGVTLNDEHFEALESTTLGLPARRDLSNLWVQWSFLQADYRKYTNFFLFNRTEDINLGWQLRARLGKVLPALGAYEQGWLQHVQADKVWPLTDHSWLVMQVSWSGLQLDNVPQDNVPQANLATSAMQLSSGQFFVPAPPMAEHTAPLRQQLWHSHLYYIHKFNERHILLTQLQLNRGRQLFRDQLFSLGGDDGMRAFPLYYQHGQKSLVTSMEYRYITDWHLYQLMDVAIAGFVDSGRAWDNPYYQNQLDQQRLHGYGIGLRLLPSHASRGSIISIDLAKPVTDNPELSGWRWRLIAKRPF
jgi:hypothetical protein